MPKTTAYVIVSEARPARAPSVPVPRVAPEVKKILGDLSRQRGRRNEEEAVALLAADWKKRPAWLGEVRLATRAEDRAGVDLVAASDVGPLYVQVKSSNDGRRRYELRGRRCFMVEVVVAPVRCPGLYRARLLDALADLRRRVQAKRRERGEVRE